MKRRIAAALTALVLAGGCGGDDAGQALDDPAGGAPAAEPAVAPLDQTELPPDEGSLQDVEATLTEWSVTLSQDSVPAGPTAFNVRNAGTMTHRFEVEGNGEEWESEDLSAGGEVTMSLNLSPGTYEVYCPIVADGESHRERGMTKTLRVY